MHFYAQEYSKALGRTITFQDIPVEPWRNALFERGFTVRRVTFDRAVWTKPLAFAAAAT